MLALSGCGRVSVNFLAQSRVFSAFLVGLICTMACRLWDTLLEEGQQHC